MDDLIFNEKVREAHTKWRHAQMLGILIAREFINNPKDKDKLAELGAVLAAEAGARIEFEQLLITEQALKEAEPTKDGGKDGNGHDGHDGEGKKKKKN